MIYFIKDYDNNYVKIGYSHDPQHRLRQLQTGSYSDLKILVVIPGTMVEEKALHKQFIDYRVRGEWYRYKGALEIYIDSLLAINTEAVETFKFNKADYVPISITEPLSNYIHIDSKVSLQKNNDDKIPVIAISLLFFCVLMLIAGFFISSKK